MRFLPSQPSRRRATLGGDLAVVLLLLLFAWLGFKVHDAVQELNTLSRGVTSAGTQVQDSLRRAGDAVAGTPVVGGPLRDSLQSAGRETGGKAVAGGREAEDRIDSLARLLGFLTWFIPSLLLLTRYLPDRIRQITRLTAGARVLQTGPLTAERRRLIAERAAFGLPYGALLRHTRDPLGDLEAGRHDALVAAELEAAGLEAIRPAG